MNVSKLFADFLRSEKAGGILLITCTIISITLANASFSQAYLNFWNFKIVQHSLAHWINDGLMAIFFLLIGLELKRELYIGELSTIKKAVLPAVAAIGGMIVPAVIFLLFNAGLPTQSGVGIPMATDIAFAIGILSLLGNRVPVSLKVLLTALAVIDDLGAIIVIAIFYTDSVSFLNLIWAIGVAGLLFAFNRLKINNILLYATGGIALWYFVLQSGIHATIAGVLLAFLVPFDKNDQQSLSNKLQYFLHKPVTFIILPLFALANTCIVIESNCITNLTSMISLGVFIGLVAGKPFGIFVFSILALVTRVCVLPAGIHKKHLMGIGFLGGIGFTMSIFIALLAFNDAGYILQAKIAILLASFVSGVFGYCWLHYTLPPKEPHSTQKTS